MNVKSNKHEASEAAAGRKAAAVALTGKVTVTPGQVLSDKPVPRKPVTIAKGTAKGGSGAATAVTGTGKAGGVGGGKGAVKGLPVPPASVVVPPLSAQLNAGKPKVLGLREARLADTANVEGFNLARWGVVPGTDQRRDWAVSAPTVTAADIKAARALGFGKGATSGNELSLACCLGLVGRWGSIEAVAMLCSGVTNNNGSIKQNVIRRAIGHGLVAYINPADGTFTGTDKTMFKLPNWYNSGSRACAAVRPTAAGLELIAKAMGGIEHVPDYMRYSAAEIAALADKAKADKKAARDKAKAVKAKVGSVKRK